MNCLSVDKAQPPVRAVWLGIIAEALAKSEAARARMCDRGIDSEDASAMAALDVGVVLGHCEAHYERHGISLCAFDILEDAERLGDSPAELRN